jgi:hypothetical protein
MKNIIIAVLAIALIGSIWYQSTADYTMSEAQAKAYCTPTVVHLPVFRNKAIVFFANNVHEDDLYIRPQDMGKVDLQPLPKNVNLNLD